MTTKCLTGGDQEPWQREREHCHECSENCGRGDWMPGVEKVERMLGKGAGAGMEKCLKGQAKAFGFGLAGNRSHNCSYRVAHSRASVNDG